MQKLKARFGETTPATIANESFRAADKVPRPPLHLPKR
jgi:hypothetical protein